MRYGCRELSRPALSKQPGKLGATASCGAPNSSISTKANFVSEPEPWELLGGRRVGADDWGTLQKRDENWATQKGVGKENNEKTKRCRRAEPAQPDGNT